MPLVYSPSDFITIFLTVLRNNTIGINGYGAIGAGDFNGDKFTSGAGNFRYIGGATFRDVYISGLDLYCSTDCSATLIDSQVVGFGYNAYPSTNYTLYVSNSNMPTSKPSNVNYSHVSTTQEYSSRSTILDNSSSTALNVTQSGTGNILSLFDSTTEVFTVLDGGNVGIGTTNPGYKLQVGMAGDGSEARANAWNTLSDARLKENINLFTDPLGVIDQLQGVRFTWKGTGEESMGFIAQDLEKVLPEVVSTGVDGYKSVNYPVMNALLAEGIKDLNKKVDAILRLDEFGNPVNTTLPTLSTTELDVLALDTKLTSLKDRIGAIEQHLGERNEQDAQFASVSATLASLKDDVEMLKGAQYVASVSAILADEDLPVAGDATTIPNLIVTGHTNVYDLAVTGRITSGLLAIDGLSCTDDENCAASVSTFSGPLRLQELAAGAVEIMAGKVRINPSGDMTIDGTLTVGEVKADTVTTKNLNLEDNVSISSGDLPPTGICQTGAVYVFNDKAADEAQMYICTKKSWEEVEMNE